MKNQEADEEADFQSRREKSAGRGTLDRLPPHDEQMEMGVLGCCLQDPNQCIGECIEKLKDNGKSAFYDLRHQTIYETLVEMFNARHPVDLITVQQHLKDRQLLEQVGGIAYLSQLQDAVPSAANLSYYLEKLQEKWVLRKLISTCGGIVGKIYDYEGGADELLDEAEREVMKVRSIQTNGRDDMKSLWLKTINKLDVLFSSGGKITGLETGLPELDKITDGLHAGEMIVIAGFPSTGKTALANQIAFHNAKMGVPVGIFSLEMHPTQLNMRAVCSEARVNLFDIRDGNANELDFDRLRRAGELNCGLPMRIENASGYSSAQLTALARRLKQEINMGLMVVDYIQLVSHKADSREQEVSGISKAIKSIAMQLEIPVIALSQLNDDGKLRESRAIGQDADGVWKLKNDGERVPNEQPIILDIEKNREGAVGSVPLLFRKIYTRFESRTK